MDCDLTVAYRVYPKISKTPALHPDDKRKLVEACLRSFAGALGGLRTRVIALLDGCPDVYEDLFRSALPDVKLQIERLPGVGNRATFGIQIDRLLDAESPFVYFAEDDYFYLPRGLEKLVAFARAFDDVGFATPFDHPDLYRLKLHQHGSQVRVHGDRHWRTSASACLTFLARRDVLRRTQRVLRSYCDGNLDASMWLALTKEQLSPRTVLALRRSEPWTSGIPVRAWRRTWRDVAFGARFRLWTPMPTLATHVEKADLAPLVDWERAFAAFHPDDVER